MALKASFGPYSVHYKYPLGLAENSKT